MISRELSGKELAAEMVHTFLLPEVDKEILRHRGEYIHVYNSCHSDQCSHSDQLVSVYFPLEIFTGFNTS